MQLSVYVPFTILASLTCTVCLVCCVYGRQQHAAIDRGTRDRGESDVTSLEHLSSPHHLSTLTFGYLDAPFLKYLTV